MAYLNNKTKIIGAFNLVPKREVVKASRLWQVAEEACLVRGITPNKAAIIAAIKKIVDEEKGVFDLVDF